MGTGHVPVDDMIESCFHCGSNRFTTSRWLAFGSIRLIRCAECNLVHLYPIGQHTSGYEELNDTETQRQLRLYDETDTTGFNHGNGILDLVENYIREGRVLDIGCKLGEFLTACKRRGWHPVGVDLNPAFCKETRARGFEIYDDVLEHIDPGVKDFDLIVMSHVLEHIERPDVTLQSAYRRLKPNGLLYVETPDMSSPIAWGIYRERWLGVATPGHVWAFTSNTLQNVVQHQGFNVIWSNRWIPYARHDYPKTIKGQCRRFLFSLINLCGYGDIVGVLARKPEQTT